MPDTILNEGLDATGSCVVPVDGIERARIEGRNRNA